MADEMWSPNATKPGETPGEFYLDGKRFQMPYTLSGKCPECDTPFRRNYGAGQQHYLSYAKVNKPSTLPLYCPECDHEWSVPIEITMTFKVLAEDVVENEPEPKES